MKIDWPHDRCLACLRPFDDTNLGSRSDAHIVPEALGGRLSLTALCRQCNSVMGAAFEDDLPLDPTLRAEIERFADAVPIFKKQLTKAGRDYVGKTEHGFMTMKRQKDESFRAMDTENPDGSRLKDAQDAARELRGMLEKREPDRTKIEATMARFAEGHAVSVDDRIFVPRTSDVAIDIPWGAEQADLRGYLSIATLFLAMNIGDRIYGEEFAPIRRTLLDVATEGDSGSWSVTQSRSVRDSEMWHRVEMAEGTPHVAIDVTLFGQWHYRVTFNDFSWRGEKFGLLDDFGERRLYSKNLDSDEPTMELVEP